MMEIPAKGREFTGNASLSARQQITCLARDANQNPLEVLARRTLHCIQRNRGQHAGCRGYRRGRKPSATAVDMRKFDDAHALVLTRWVIRREPAIMYTPLGARGDNAIRH